VASTKITTENKPRVIPVAIDFRRLLQKLPSKIK
jgi:hypothetical protein